MKKDPERPEKKRRNLLKEFNAACKRLRWKDLKDLGKETLQDLKKPKEIFLLIATIILPGGLIIYPIYRITKYYNKHKPVNDNDKKPEAPKEDAAQEVSKEQKKVPPQNKPPAP